MAPKFVPLARVRRAFGPAAGPGHHSAAGRATGIVAPTPSPGGRGRSGHDDLTEATMPDRPAAPDEADRALTDPPLTDPARTDPALVEPALAEPALTDPALAEPALAEPALADPALADPALADPALADSELGRVLAAAELGQVLADPEIGPAVLAAAEVADSVLDDRLPMADPRPAAVLCALFEEDHDTWLVLTRRSTQLRSHTGEVSFPGGRLDRGETPMAAALREADEEVGIDPASVEVIGRLSPLATMSSRAEITPFVGVLERRPELRPNPAEVELAFTVPLSELMAPGVYHEERWGFPGGGDRAIHFFDLPDDTVWGATAKMLRELLDRTYPAPE